MTNITPLPGCADKRQRAGAMPSFADEVAAVRDGGCDDMRRVGSPFVPLVPGTNETDEGSPFCWFYAMDSGKGFLVCWPGGARLRVQNDEWWAWNRKAVDAAVSLVA